MKIETWRELLQTLLDATVSRRTKWRETDAGSFVASMPTGSVSVRGVPGTRSLGHQLTVALGNVPSVELRDSDGEVAAELLPLTGVASAARSVLGESDARNWMQGDLRALVDRLIEAIDANRVHGENVARSIIDDLRHGRT